IKDNKIAIGIIAAREGSKGLPGKNIRSLCGKPLIVWTIEKALRSHSLKTVIVSTDCSEIADAARKAGAEVPFLRPPELATDTASSYDVIRHALSHFTPHRFDYTVLLEDRKSTRMNSSH